MAMQTWSKTLKQRYDPVHFLLRRSIFPGARQQDQLLRQRIALAQDLHWKDLKGHYGCVNAIEFSQGSGEFIASGGDDRRVLVWPVEKMLSDVGTPVVMSGEHNSNIFCIAFDSDNTTLFSAGNDEQVVVHDLNTGETKDVFPHEDAVYGLSADPCNPSVFASACDDGRLLIFDIRDSAAEPFCVANYTSSMHSVMYNPVEPRLLATANAKEGVGLWDVRKPKSCVLRYGGGYVQQSCMSVRFNQHGDQIIALRRRLPPVLYKIHSHLPVCEFDHTGYYNSCTMKSISFAGDNDQYVLSGSDDFNLYMWAIPEDLSDRLYINSAHMVLRGHRSIVNQVRFNQANHIIISSGVEKIVKVWSPFRLPSTSLSVGKDLFKERPVYSHDDYINLVLRNGSMMTHDYTEASTEEDPRMIAFFDSLVQRELEGWSSDDTLSSNEEAMYTRIMQLSSSDSESTISSISGLDGTLDTIGVDDLDDSIANSDNPESNSVTDSGLGTSWSTNVARMMHGGRANSPVSPPSKGKTLSKLIRKKKEGLKDGFYRNCSRLNLSSSSDTSSDEEPVNTVIHKGDAGKSGKGKNPIFVQNLMKQRQQAMQASFVKLKRLNTLRNQVLNSDSDTEINLASKEIGESVKTNEEKGASKEVKIVSHKGKKHTETASARPYVHEMCHIFELGSPSEPVCSTSFDDSNTSEMFSQLRGKWKPIGSESSVLNSYSNYNNVSCDSNETSLMNNKHATSDMHGECDKSIPREHDVEALISSSAIETKGPVNDSHSKGIKYVDTASFVSTNRIKDGKKEHVPCTESELVLSEHKHVNGCNNSLSVSITEKINDSRENESSNKSDKEEVVCTSEADFNSGEMDVHVSVSNKDKNADDNLPEVKHEEGSDVFPAKIHMDNTHDRDSAGEDKFDNKLESKSNDINLPSCSTQPLDQSLYSDYKKSDSPEFYRDAWTDFKKRKESNNSRKHYRGHKRSDRQGSWD